MTARTLVPERLARLRTWAQRRNPDRPHHNGGRAHHYYAFCPWCSDVGDPDLPGDDGNAHDLAIELLDEIDRLRAVIQEVRDWGTPEGPYGCAWCAREIGDEVGHRPDCAWLKIVAVTDA